MSCTDLDPWVIKTLVLLQSKAEDSADKLRDMLDETIRLKSGGRRSLKPLPGIPKPAQSPVKSEDIPSKKSKTEPKPKPAPIGVQNISEASVSSDDSDNLAMDILEDDLSCAVCREIAFGPRNRLVECSECHSLYHQECHVPSITDSDINDPFKVWHCSSCNKTKSSKTSSSSSSSSKNIFGKSSSVPPRTSSPIGGYSKPFGSITVPPKKSSSKSNSSSSSSTSSSKPPATTSSSTAPSNTTSTSSSKFNSNISAVDRRLQIMKKRAAKKQEKRIQPK